MRQTTLCLLKPDIVYRHLIGDAIKALESNFSIIRMMLKQLSREKIEKFYDEHKEKVFFPQLIEFMMMGPVVALELEADDSIYKLRKMLGDFNPQIAEEGSLRRRFGISMDQNSFHGSDSEKAARNELTIIFEEE